MPISPPIDVANVERGASFARDETYLNTACFGGAGEIVSEDLNGSYSSGCPDTGRDTSDRFA